MASPFVLARDGTDRGNLENGRSSQQQASLASLKRFRGPVDLVLLDEERLALVANQLSNSVSLVDLDSSAVIDEVAVGVRPEVIERLGEAEALVTCRDSGSLVRLRVEKRRIVVVDELAIGWEPMGLAVANGVAFVGLMATGQVAVVDLGRFEVIRKIDVGIWPRYLTAAKDGKRVAVGLSGSNSVAVIDVQAGSVLYDEPLSGGINIGHMVLSSDESEVYFPWMVYRSNPITPRNIQRGWVLASRIARIRMDGPSYREAISLDVSGEAVADPCGIALTTGGEWLVVSSGGTHELLVYRFDDMPLQGAGGPGDLIDPQLARDQRRFRRVDLGGRPMGMVASKERNKVWVANYLTDAIQGVDVSFQGAGTQQTRSSEISLGSQPDDQLSRKVHHGRELFFDAGKSLDQWYSCHSCHLDGGTNSKPMDTWNDGTELTSKTVLPLAGVLETSPWTWHGWQEDLEDSIQNSFTSTMKGPAVGDRDVQALIAYLGQLPTRASPFRDDPATEDSRERGKALFFRDDVGCSDCHSGPRFTDGLIHDVGMSRASDRYEGFNTPSLVGVYQRPRLLHDGRAKNLEAVLTRWHTAEEIGGGAQLSEQELADLIAYLRSL